MHRQIAYTGLADTVGKKTTFIQENLLQFISIYIVPVVGPPLLPLLVPALPEVAENPVYVRGGGADAILRLLAALSPALGGRAVGGGCGT